MRWKKAHTARRIKAKKIYTLNTWIARADKLVGWYMREGCLSVEDSFQGDRYCGHNYILINQSPRPIGCWHADERNLRLFGVYLEVSAYVAFFKLSLKHRYSRQVATDLIHGAHISTVFLGIDHDFMEGPPVLYETMVFGDADWKSYQRRYATREEALAGHAEILEQFESGLILVADEEHVDIFTKVLKAMGVRSEQSAPAAAEEWPEEFPL